MCGAARLSAFGVNRHHPTGTAPRLQLQKEHQQSKEKQHVKHGNPARVAGQRSMRQLASTKRGLLVTPPRPYMLLSLVWFVFP